MIIRLIAQVPALDQLSALQPEAGPGPIVLCAPEPLAVATAQRLFPDRRIEVKALYQEPGLHGQGLWQLWRWLWRPKEGEEDVALGRRRVIDATVRLVQVCKEHKAQPEATLVGGPLFLRLLAIKLNSIGYQGPLFSAFKPGQAKRYSYQA